MKLDWWHVVLVLIVFGAVLALAWFAYKSEDPNAWAVVGTAITGAIALAGAAFRAQSSLAKMKKASLPPPAPTTVPPPPASGDQPS